MGPAGFPGSQIALLTLQQSNAKNSGCSAVSLGRTPPAGYTVQVVT